MVSYNDQLWILGGSGYPRLNDVWYSSDGITWTEATPAAPWSGRMRHVGLVFDNKIWIMGGYDDYWQTLNDVWYSEDGANWTEATDDAPWAGRDRFAGVVFDGKMWISGGWSQQYGMIMGDMWCSTDGTNWTYKGGGCGHRGLHTMAVFDNRMLMVAGWYEGYLTNRVWYSENGTTWTESLPRPPWAPCAYPGAFVMNDRLYILGGNDGIDEALEVWYTEGFGEDLTAGFSAAPILGTPPLTVQFTDESTAFVSEIVEWSWDFGDGMGSSDPSPSHVYENRGAYTVSLTVTNADGKTDTETKPVYIVVQGDGHAYHSADRDQDYDISLSELLRVIQFYNLDALHCAAGTEDGYAPLSGDDTCFFHDADYSPPDWKISMNELLRVAQIFNAAGYEACATGEDGFCLITK